MRTLRRRRGGRPLIVGAGAGGSVLAQRLARQGLADRDPRGRAVLGPRRGLGLRRGRLASALLDREAHHRRRATRSSSARTTAGRGVGGSMIHYAGYTPRFHPSDFETYTRDGVGADWPISYDELKPHYEELERELPVAGQDWPWGDPHAYPFSPTRSRSRRAAVAGRAAPGHRDARRARSAIVNGTLRQPPALHLPRLLPAGLQGQREGEPATSPTCPTRSSHGVEMRADCMAVAGRARRDRAGHRRHLRPRRSEPSASSAPRASRSAAIRSRPRGCCCNSASKRLPNGLGNNDDLVGRYVMVQGAPRSQGGSPSELRMYKAPPPEVSSEQFYETDPDAGFARGFSIQTVSPTADRLGRARARRRALGPGAAGVHARLQPLEHDRRAQRAAAQAENRVTLAEEKDRDGMPVARFDYTRVRERPREHGLSPRRVIKTILAGRRRPGHPHDPALRPPDRRLPGWAPAREQRRRRRPPRLGRPEPVRLPTAASCPTQGSANPALTIMALSSRLAELLAGKRVTGRNGLRPDLLARRRRSTPPSSRNGPPEFAQRASQEPT